MKQKGIIFTFIVIFTMLLSINIYASNVIKSNIETYVNGVKHEYNGVVVDGVQYVESSYLKSMLNGNDVNVTGVEERTYNGFTYLPLRAFAENLPNVKIYFEPKTQSIIITTDGSNPETNLPADVQTQINTQPTPPTDPIPPELVDTPQPITPQYNPNAPSVVNGEARPTQPGTYDGELSSGGNWCWDAPMKKWIKWNKDGGNVSLNIDESDLSDSTKEAYQRYIEASKKNN